ncbi:OmpA family protein [Streptomyces antibioticus]|uniref:OmpA family protein n=1 Tax=Streptomyces antibioticus TaxID=1890 RepID=A0AAE7CPA3_STRAT|nr:OmpA family protein [Streptomyces antibioticus]QIT48322.1 OmpA family protein [Streptomyces antibioticus]
MKRTTPRRTAVLAAALLMASALAGCQDEGGGDNTTVQNNVDDKQCADVRNAEQPASAKTVALIGDVTASVRAHEVAPPGAADVLTVAQKEHARVTFVPVDGTDAVRDPVAGYSLDPLPDNRSAFANRVRAAAVACARRDARGSALRPRKPGSDLLTALATAARERPSWIVIDSDGISTAGALDLADTGYDVSPDDLVAQLRESGSLPRLPEGVRVTWLSLGSSSVPLGTAQVEQLRALWRALLTASGVSADDIEFDDRAAPAATATPSGGTDGSGLPQDTVPEPKVVSLNDGWEIPAALLFAPESARLLPSTETTLQDVADRIRAAPGARRYTVTGHTAAYGTAAGRRTLSVQRATAVRDALVRLGVPRDRLTVRGVGATRPKRPEILPDGTHDLSAARENRRVVIEPIS